MTNQNRMNNMAQGWADMAERMTRLNNETMMAGVRGMQPWLDAYSRLFTPVLPAARCGCQIPETECPPYCACTLDWTMAPGDTRAGHIQIKNTSKEYISYSLAATPLESCEGATETTPQLEPESGRVAPGESLHVQVLLTADKSWRRGRHLRIGNQDPREIRTLRLRARGGSLRAGGMLQGGNGRNPEKRACR